MTGPSVGGEVGGRSWGRVKTRACPSHTTLNPVGCGHLLPHLDPAKSQRLRPCLLQVTANQDRMLSSLQWTHDSQKGVSGRGRRREGGHIALALSQFQLSKL